MTVTKSGRGSSSARTSTSSQRVEKQSSSTPSKLTAKMLKVKEGVKSSASSRTKRKSSSEGRRVESNSLAAKPNGSGSSHASPGRPNALSSSKRLRIPGDYPWRLLSLVVGALKDRLSSAFLLETTAAIRGRDVSQYWKMDESYGLQCMHRWQRPFLGDPQAVRLIVSLIRKHPSLALVSPKQRKLDCLLQVKELDLSLPMLPKPSWGSDGVYQATRRILEEILGPTPMLDDIANSARHGPGSSLTHCFERRSAYYKFADLPLAVCPTARDMLIQVISLDERWVASIEGAFRRAFRIEPWRLISRSAMWNWAIHPEYNYNKITTVPKDGAKDRPIAIEPAGNIYLQLGIEGLIRSRLKRFGVNLDSQDKNRKWCGIFSKENDGATIDLSNASDTVSVSFCSFMLPKGWFDLLSSVRSPYGVFPDGTAWRYAKMSSMGNGTTFVLESLLFYALSKAISEKFGTPSDRIAVFGDDLLIEDYLLWHHMEYLRYSGFTPNLTKSFGKGNVRESCGIDSFQGVDIRPVFIKHQPSDDMMLYNDRNRLNRWFGIHYGCSNPRTVDDFFMKYISRDLLLGPESDTEFDGYWHCPGFRAGMEFSSWRRRTVELPARDFDFRKLMHDLRGPSEGGKFLVSEVREGGMTLVRRVVTQVGDSPAMGYHDGHVLLDQTKPEYCL